MLQREKNHLVVGFGATGLSMVKVLHQIGVKNIWAMDSRETPPNYDAIAHYCSKIATGGFSEELLAETDYLWVSPGVSIKEPLLARYYHALPSDAVGGDIELFARLATGSLIAITGTNGKSTVTTLLGAICRAAKLPLYMGGNLGEPALNLWLQAEADGVAHPLYLLELSSFQLETTKYLTPDVGVLLNLSPDHLDRYEGYGEYIATKCSLLSMSHRCVIGAELQEIVAAEGIGDDGSMGRFSLSDEGGRSHYSADLERELILKGGAPLCSYRESRLSGLHNLLNIIAAVAIADTYGVTKEAIEEGIATYQPLAHRSYYVGSIDGVTYINDSKATNIASTIAAIKGFPGRKWLILGGVTKGQDFTELAPYLDDSIVGVVLIGSDYSEILNALPAQIPRYEMVELERAITFLRRRAESGEIVLFSPACASFDQYRSFEARGDHFVALVEANLHN